MPGDAASIRRLSAGLRLPKGRPPGRIETKDASGSPPKPLGFDTSLRSYSAGAGIDVSSSSVQDTYPGEGMSSWLTEFEPGIIARYASGGVQCTLGVLCTGYVTEQS